MKTYLLILALGLSSLSLGLELKKIKPAPPLQRFVGPAKISELDRRMELADIEMTRESIPMRNGVGVPFVREISNDLQHITVRVLVDSEDLPKSYDERKKVLLDTAQNAWVSVYSAFDLKIGEKSAPEVVVVEFLNIPDLVKDNNRVYAEFKDGQLSFH